MARHKKDEQSFLDRLLKPGSGSEKITWNSKVIEKENAEGQSFSETGQYPVISDVQGGLEVCNGDSSLFIKALNLTFKNAYLAAVRQRVAAQATGVDRMLNKAAKAFAAATGMTEEAALEILKAKRAENVK